MYELSTGFIYLSHISSVFSCISFITSPFSKCCYCVVLINYVTLYGVKKSLVNIKGKCKIRK